MRYSEITENNHSEEWKTLVDVLNDALDTYHSLKDSLGSDAAQTKVALERVKKARQATEDFAHNPPTPPEIPDSDIRSPFHHYKPRGGFTLDKVRKHLRANPSLRSAGSFKQLYDTKGRSAFAKEIKKFSSPQEFADHLYWHGTGGHISGGLRPGGILPKGTEFGGGYDEPYHVISVSKSKNIASEFTGQSRFGMVHPVLLRKNANVVSMPGIEDAQELEDILPQLWDRRIDAVKIGNWSNPHSEQELCIVNPRAVILGSGESFPVYNKQKFDEPTEAEIAEVYRQAFEKPVTESYEHPYKLDPERRKKIKTILRILSKNKLFQSIKDRIYIFGSVARGNPDAGDVDIILDCSDLSYETTMRLQGVNDLLSLSRQFYGLIDVFIQTERWMFVRNEHATGWDNAKNIRAIRRGIKADAKPLDEVVSIWDNFNL